MKNVMPTSPLPGTATGYFSHVDPTLIVVSLCLAAYLLGSVPFGLILARLFGYGDLRKIGSGNIGATNALRTGNKLLALLTLLLDGGKGALAVAAGFFLYPLHMVPIAMGLAAVIGHCFPVWLKFKGGKGAATAFGVILALDWELGLCLLALWLIMAFLFRYSSLAALTAFIAAPLLAWFMGKTTLVLPLIALAALIVFKHHENMQKILQKTESKIGDKA